MVSRFISSIAGALALCPLIFSPAAAQENGGALNIIVQPEPSTLMLGLASNTPTWLVGGSIYEGLLSYSHDLDPQPALAKAWTVSDDGLTYTFTLHSGVKWHDGKPLTAEDVVFTADVFLRETSARARNLLVHVKSITATDDTTVVFQLTQPFSPFIYGLDVTGMPIIPKHIYDGTDFATNPMNATPIGAGPFKFDKWVKGSYIRLVKNEDYFMEGLPRLDEVYFHVIPDAASRAVAIETGKVDVGYRGAIENWDIKRLAETKDVCVTSKGEEFNAPLSWLWLNNRAGPTSDKRFRQAVMHAIDREKIREIIFEGYGRVATGPISSKTKFYSPDVKVYDYNPEKAKALLADMGYSGEPVRLLPLPYGETYHRWGEAVRQNLQEAGINVVTDSTDIAGYNEKAAQWDYDMAFTYTAQYADPALGVARYYLTSQIAKGSPYNNVEGYENAELDKKWDAAAQIMEPEGRAAAYAEIQKELVEDVPVAWLQELEFPTVYRCNVHDLVTTGTGVIEGTRRAWISK